MRFDRVPMRNAARSAMVDEMMDGEVLDGAAVRRAFDGLEAALRVVFRHLDKQEAAALALDRDAMKQIILDAQSQVAALDDEYGDAE